MKTARPITAPNADTLYTIAWLDVAKEPWVVSLPDLQGRYALFPMLDGWTNVFQVPGKRTTGTGAQTYAITGPGWSGTLPAGVVEYKSPTALVWLLGRIYCTGTPQDYAAVHALQDQCKLVPLSSWGKDYTPPPGKVDPSIDMKTAVRDQVNRMSAVEYFTLLAELMKTNPPAAADAPALARFARIGIGPGVPFDPAKLSPSLRTALEDGVASAAKELKAKALTQSSSQGFFGTRQELGPDYLTFRSMGALLGIYGNSSEEAIYASQQTGPDGKVLDGRRHWLLRFEPGQLPPVTEFWSVTMYNLPQRLLVNNPINRYSIGDRTPGLKLGADGSLEIYIQSDDPGTSKASNWLPAPAGPFFFVARLYGPKPSALKGTWKLPALVEIR